MKDRVVCVNDNFLHKDKLSGPWPVKGNIYELDGIDKHPNSIDGSPYYYIKGFDWIVTTIYNVSGRVSFTNLAFRPVKSIDLWLEDEQLAYLEALEILMPGVEVIRGGYRALK